ncbi:uroporphyrinogen-III synthase [Pseudorhodobacter sp.]|uniref:uroporphyrinogen-III synthase n=1 Tax=Pseudorhodobacter sp. TaxID=1934400 RepID=UPI00264714C1|nr:uroporphyrinogen-III synthase [Pseudorhodobacter sp.]MDN5785994.1 uroporphyrinogen-III synthase [Pseudorhodobacter sp.]
MPIQSRHPAFLLTRPAAQSLRFAAALRLRFGGRLSVTISPLIAPEYLQPALPEGPFTALVFTSETGVRAFERHPMRGEITTTRAFCVGDRTAKAARAAGLEPASANGDAIALMRLINDAAPEGALIHFRAEHARADMAQMLRDSGFIAQSCVVYRQIPQALAPQAIALLQGETPLLVPLFSPRSAALFSAQVKKLCISAQLSCVALSEAVAASLGDLPDVKLFRAAEPTAEAMLAAVAEALDQAR